VMAAGSYSSNPAASMKSPSSSAIVLEGDLTPF